MTLTVACAGLIGWLMPWARNASPALGGGTGWHGLGLLAGRIGSTAETHRPIWKEPVMTHPNEQIIRDGFAAFSAGDQETLRRVIAVDAVWHVPGRNPLAGSYQGIEEILGFFGKTVALSEGTFATDVHDVVGNDEHVFAAYTVSGQRGGKSLRDNAVLVFHVQEGKVTEAWGTAGDQYATDEFWS